MQQTLEQPKIVASQVSIGSLPQRALDIFNKIGNDAVLLPMLKGSKQCFLRGWPKWTTQDSLHPRNWQAFACGNIGVKLGSSGANICSIDMDFDEWAEKLAAINPVLQSTFQTRGRRGRNFWLKVPEGIDFVKSVTSIIANGTSVGEWRADGGLTVILGTHPEGMNYTWLNDFELALFDPRTLNFPEGMRPGAVVEQITFAEGDRWKPTDEDTKEFRDMRSNANSIIQEIDWQCFNGGLCECPGIHLHSTKNGKRDCMIQLFADGHAWLKCFHKGACKDLRIELSKRINCVTLELSAEEEETLVVDIPTVSNREVNRNGHTVNQVNGASEDIINDRIVETPVTSESAMGLRIPGITVATAPSRSDVTPGDPMWWKDPENGIQFDGEHFWVKNEKQIWEKYKEAAVIRMLKCAGIWAQAKGSPYTPMDTAVLYLQKNHRIAGAFSMCQHEPWVYFNSQWYLNTCTQVALRPHPTAGAWGELFPWIARIFDALDPIEQKQYFLAWLRRYYISGIELSPSMGQAIFLAGKPKSGKTLLNRRILGRLLGGHSDPAQHLLGDKNFTKALFASPLLALDDAVCSADPKKKMVYTETIKKLVANPSLPYEAKYGDEFEAEWKGRLVITLNDDAQSIRALPEITDSIKDKVHLFKMGDSLINTFPNDIEQIIEKELPHFGAYLLAWEPPAEIMKDSRYGVTYYHEKQLAEWAVRHSETADLGESLESFLDHTFTDPGWKAKPFFKDGIWLGKQTDLRKAIAADDTYAKLMSSYLNRSFDRQLLKLSQKEWSNRYKIEHRDNSRNPWAITAVIEPEV